MASKDDRKAALILLALAALGLGVRLAVGGAQAPGAVFYWGADAERPSRDSVAALASLLARPLVPGEKIDIDKASAAELTRLPRIGPGLAARIVADREARGPFGSLEEFDRVAGVGPSLMEMTRAHAVFSGRPSRRTDGGGGRVRVNSATVDELARLPGIGPARAQAIAEDRQKHGPYRTIESLTRVPGIGPATVERLRALVVVP